MTRRSFGQVRGLPSGRFQARFRREGKWHTARAADGGPRTFSTRRQAEKWLDRTGDDIAAGTWSGDRPVAVPVFVGYAESWLAVRDLAPRTRIHYRALLSRHILPTFGRAHLDKITSDQVRTWWAGLNDTPTLRAHCYSLLRSILATAVTDGVIKRNPCTIRGGGSSKRRREIRELSVADLDALVTAMPARYRTMTLLGAWCALRFGELTELRRRDVDLRAGKLRVDRAVVWRRETGFVVGPPKSEAGRRTVDIPPHLLPALVEHLRSMPVGPDALLFPSATNGHLQASTVHKAFKRARASIDRQDLRWHDLRHTGNVLAGMVPGATLADQMARLGHATQGAALRYQHAAEDRGAMIAAGLSDLAQAEVTPIRKRRTG